MNERDAAKMPNGVHIIIVVYGEEYSSLLSEVTLANLAGMVQEIPDDLRRLSLVRIFCRMNDLPIIRTSRALPVLQQHIRVELLDSVQIAGFEEHGGYGPMVVTQARAVVEASQQNAAIFFVGPDQIYNRGAFALFVDCLRNGYRVVVGQGARIKRDAVRPFLNTCIAGSSDGTLSLAPEEQVGLLFRYWHPINDQFCLESESGVFWKAYVFYRPHLHELFVRFFQGPTLVAWPRIPMNEFVGFVDHKLILHCCRSWREAYVVKDGLDCLALDMTEDGHKAGLGPSDSFYGNLFLQLINREAINDMQLLYGLQTCRIHLGERDPRLVERWAKDLAGSIDPLILLAGSYRVVANRLDKVVRIFRRLPRLMIMYPASAILRTLSFLLRPIIPFVFKNKLTR